MAGGILWRNGRFLAAQRPAGSEQAGFWEFPGGKIESGETPEQALIRELAEELSVSECKLLFWQTLDYDYPHQYVRLHLFHVLHFVGEPVPNDGQTLCWITTNEALTLPFLAADAALLPYLVSPI